MVGLLNEVCFFGSMEDEECGYDHTRIDDYSAQGRDKEN